MPAVAEIPTAAAPAADWRARERRRQSIAHELHRAAAIDLAAAESLWGALPTDGPVDELLAVRHASAVPSIHLSRAAAGIAVWSCIAEMAERRGAAGWSTDSLSGVIRSRAPELPALAARLDPLAEHLPRLREASAGLEDLEDDELARVAGRTYEFGLTTSWLFRHQGEPPERLSHVWRAKQAGCFFTPEFVARHLAATALDEDALHVLDPAVGGAAFLVEAFHHLRALGVDDPADRLHGVDLDAALADLSAVVVEFLSGVPFDGELSSRSRFRAGDSLLAPLSGALPSGPTWQTWFPDVMDAGGFDVVLMNPPYLQLKVNHSSLPARAGDSEEAEALRLRGVEQARATARQLSEQLRAHPDFRHAHGGVPDLPRYFVERALSVLRPGGRLACIVPSTFLADHRSKGLRRHLLADHAVREVDLIPEDARLFADVNQPTCLLVVDKGRASEGRIRMRTGITSPGALAASRAFSVSPALLRAVDPEQLRVPGCEPDDWAILAVLHQHPSLGDHDWVENLRGELDLTQDREFVSATPTGLALVRGDQVERFTSSLPSDKPRWVTSAFLRESVSHRKLQHIEQLRVVGRQCSYLKKPRRLSFSLIEPGAVVGNSCNYLVVRDGDALARSRYLTGALNSSVLEWRFRLTSSTNHVGNYELDALPLPLPTEDLLSRVNPLVERLLRDPADVAADRELDDVWFDAYGLGPDARRRIRSVVPA